MSNWPQVPPQQNPFRTGPPPVSPTVPTNTSKLFKLASIDAPDDLERSWSTCAHILDDILSLSESDINNRLSELAVKRHNEIGLGLIYLLLTCADSDAQTFFKYLNYCTRDSLGFVSQQTIRMLSEKFHKLQDAKLDRLYWFVGELVRLKINEAEGLVITLLRQIIAGDFTARNLRLIELTLNMLQDAYIKPWLFTHKKILCGVVYTFLRLIEDHSALLANIVPSSTGNVINHVNGLRKTLITFVMEAFQNHYKDVLTIGRDMIRVVCQLALRYKLPEFAAVWTNQLLNQASYETTDYKGGIGAVLNEPTRGRYLQSRVTTEMERQLSFLMTGVKMGNQRRYQTWFQQKFMITPESELLAVDLVRYICDVFHPPHHIVTGNFVARWAMLGWLLKSIKNHVVLEQVYQAVIWDWIFCNRNESVMCLEPTMLLMVNSIPRYADITIHVLNTLFHAVDHTLIPPEQVGKNLTEAMRILSKFGIGGVDRLIDCNIIEVPLREKIKKYFGSFVPGNANSPTAQPNSPTTSPQPFTVPPPTLTPPQQPVSPTQSPTAGSPFAVPPSSPTTNKAVPIRPVKKPQAPPQSPSKPQLSSILVEPQDTVMAEQEDNHDAQSPVQPQRQADLLSPLSTADALAPKTPVEGDMDSSIKNIINGFISGKAPTDSSEFDGHLETLGKAISDYIQNNSNKSKADEAIVKTLDAFEKSSTVTEGATQQLATVIVRLLGFEFSVLNQEEHTQRVLAHSDETLTWTLLDTINKILMPMLVPDKTAQNNNNNKLKQPTRRPKGSKQVKDRFSSFLKHACMADPSMGYRVLCYCIKSFQATKQPIDKTNLQLTCSLVQLALNESNKETYTFYEYVIHLRKTQQQGTLAPSVFLSDIKSIVHENQTLFMILLPIITRDFAHYVKRIKLPILRLVAGLSPSQVNDVVGSVESGFVKIIYSKRMMKPSTTQEDSDPVKEIMDLLEKAWSNWKDYFELETLWEMILAELYSQQTEQYTTMLLKRVKQRDRQERGLDDQEDEDDDEQLEIDKGDEEPQLEQFMSLDLNQFLMTLLMNENFRENMTAHSMNKLQALILRLAAFIQQQEQRLGLNPSSAQHLLNFDCVKCIVTLPHDKFHHFASVLLHQYMQFNQQSEQFFITLVKAYDDDPLPVLTTLSHIKQLEMTQTKVHPNLNRGSRSRGLFSNERFIKQLSANKEKWKKRAGTIMTVLLTEAKKPTPPTGPPASTVKKVKPVPAAVPIIPEKRNPSKRVKRRRLPWDEETEDDFIVSDEDEIEEETSTPTEDNDEDDIEEEEEEAEGTQPPNSPGGDSDEYKDEDKEAEDDHNMSDDNSNRRSKRVSRRRVVDDEETKPNKKKRPREEEKKDEEDEDEEGEEGSDDEEKEDSDSEDDPELKTMKNIRKRRTSSGRIINKFTNEIFSFLLEKKLPFLLGGALAYSYYTGVKRDTKDLDIFVRPLDFDRFMHTLRENNFHVEKTFPHWLGKIYRDAEFVDVIYSSANGIATVDDQWFEFAEEGDCLEFKLLMMPAEEMIWSKASIMEKERFDGGDVCHLIRARGQQLDWRRLVTRFGHLWRVLYSHLVIFGMIYPQERQCVPDWVMESFTSMVMEEQTQQIRDSKKICYGTLLSRAQYLTDIHKWGYGDARKELGYVGEEDIDFWTAAIPGLEYYDTKHSCKKEKECAVKDKIARREEKHSRIEVL